MSYEVRFGNTAPIEVYRLSDAQHARSLGASDDEIDALERALADAPEGVEVQHTREAQIDNGFSHNNTVTVFQVPDTDRQMIAVLRELSGAYDGYHSQNPPEWIEAYERDDETGKRKRAKGLEAMLVDNYSVGGHVVESGMPEGWEGLLDESPPMGGGSDEAALTDFGGGFRARMRNRRNRLPWAPKHLRTNAGTDWQARVMGDSVTSGAGTSTMRAADYIALTENSTAPSAANTTLTAEVAVDGLTRAQGTYAHTNGTNTYTITRSFTFTRASAVDRTIAKIGVFNASSSGTMAFETLLSASQLLQANGDQLTVTQTVTL
jgi:hypothetical protein